MIPVIFKKIIYTEMFCLEHLIFCMRGVFHFLFFFFKWKDCTADESLRYSLEGIHAIIDERRTSLRSNSRNSSAAIRECLDTRIEGSRDASSRYMCHQLRNCTQYTWLALFSQHRVKMFWIKWILLTSSLLKATKGRCYLEIYLSLSSIFIRRYFVCFACCR